MRDSDWQKLNETFAAAAALDAAAREELLRGLDDEGLRREVEALLAAAPRAEADGFLESDAFRVGAQVLAGAEDDHPFEGRSVDKYRIVREVGRGGMGVVFLAKHVEFDHHVAVKVVKRGMDTDDIVRRFRRERKVLASLSHRYIARLLGGGTTDDGLPYFVMEHVEGLPITRFCDRRKLTVGERLRLFLKVCEAVSYAHRKLVVHRDIKPSNVLVTEAGEPRLLDFGISKLLAPGDSETTADRTAGLRVLTPQYASPEQIRGGEVTAASDVYSLGVLLYELLCGRRPFDLKDASDVETLKTVSEREPTAPSTSAVTRRATDDDGTGERSASAESVAHLRRERPEQLRRRLRGDLDNITLKALRRDPGLRYESVEQLAADIEAHLAGRPVAARPPTFKYRAAKYVRRNRRAVAFASTVALLLVAVCVSWAYFFWSRGREAGAAPAHAATAPAETGSVAVLPFKDLSGTPGGEIFAEGMTDSLIGSLSKVENLKVISRNSVYAIKDRGLTPQQISERLGVKTLLEGGVRVDGEKAFVEARLLDARTGEVLWNGGLSERRLRDVFEAQDDIARSVTARLRLRLTPAGEERMTRRQTRSVEAYQAYAKGRYFWKKKDPENLEKARRYFEEAIALDPGYALAYDGLADYYSSAIWYAGMPPRAAIPKVKAAVLKILELDPESAEAHDGLARVAWFEWDWEGYRREQERAVELAPNDASIWHNYAYMLLNRPGSKADALAAVRRAQELDPLSPSINTDVGEILTRNGRYDEAIAVFKKTIEAYPEFPSVHWNIWFAYEAKGMYEEAFEAFMESQRISGASPRVIAEYRAAFRRRGITGLRRKFLEYMLKDTNRDQRAFSIADEYAQLGEMELALEWLEKAYAARDMSMVALRSEKFAPLHSDARFQDLLRRVGLPD